MSGGQGASSLANRSLLAPSSTSSSVQSKAMMGNPPEQPPTTNATKSTATISATTQSDRSTVKSVTAAPKTPSKTTELSSHSSLLIKAAPKLESEQKAIQAAPITQSNPPSTAAVKIQPQLSAKSPSEQQKPKTSIATTPKAPVQLQTQTSSTTVRVASQPLSNQSLQLPKPQPIQEQPKLQPISPGKQSSSESTKSPILPAPSPSPIPFRPIQEHTKQPVVIPCKESSSESTKSPALPTATSPSPIPFRPIQEHTKQPVIIMCKESSSESTKSPVLPPAPSPSPRPFRPKDSMYVILGSDAPELPTLPTASESAAPTVVSSLKMKTPTRRSYLLSSRWPVMAVSAAPKPVPSTKQLPPHIEKLVQRRPGYEYLMAEVSFNEAAGRHFGLTLATCSPNKVLVTAILDKSVSSDYFSFLDRVLIVNGLLITDKNQAKSGIYASAGYFKVVIERALSPEAQQSIKAEFERWKTQRLQREKDRAVLPPDVQQFIVQEMQRRKTSTKTPAPILKKATQPLGTRLTWTEPDHQDVTIPDDVPPGKILRKIKKPT